MSEVSKLDLDTEAAADLLQGIGVNVKRRVGPEMHFAVFVWDENGGSRFVHNYMTEAELKDSMTDLLGHLGSVQ